MKATEFVKKYGLDLVKRDMACLESGFITKADFLEHYGFEILDDLKRLVESYEVVGDFGGLDNAKQVLESMNLDATCDDEFVALSEAIADVEACQ